MKLTSAEQRTLGEALMVLSGGDERRFLDLMWLGFGDQWTPILEALAQHGYVTLPEPDAYDSVRITERGVRLAQRMNGRLAKTA